MKKHILYILILIALAGLFSPTSDARASPQNPKEPCNDRTSPTNLPCLSGYILLAPLPSPGNAAKFENFNPEPTATNPYPLTTYLRLMIKLIIGLSAVMAVIMIIIGGMEYMTSELISSKEEGKKRIQGAIFGLLLALGAYAILFTINPDLLNSELNVPEAKLTVDINVDVPQVCVAGQKCGGYDTGALWNTQLAGTITGLPSGVTSRPGECAKVGDRPCTSLRGLNLNYINSTIARCNCQLVITGGTESWLHKVGSSHRPGSPTVDLETNLTLNNYITGGQPLVVGQRYSIYGVSYLYEGNHWHVGP